jgi:hypothetical protein
MTSDRLEVLTSRVHLPLMRLGMCLDCEACFEIGVTACPACGSKTWMPLARFLEAARRRRMVESVDSLDTPRSRRAAVTHHFIVVARDREALYQHFKESFAGNAAITVMLDRRRADRRTAAAHAAIERRRGDRRWRAIDEQLRVLGWAVVRVSPSATEHR